jgi:hypothetical protein
MWLGAFFRLAIEVLGHVQFPGNGCKAESWGQEGRAWGGAKVFIQNVKVQTPESESKLENVAERMTCDRVRVCAAAMGRMHPALCGSFRIEILSRNGSENLIYLHGR